MKGRNVREKPSRSRHSSRCAPRTRATRSKSTSTDVYTCALVDFDRTMCSAVRRRMLLNATTWSPVAAATGDGAAAGAGAARAGAAGAGVGLGVVVAAAVDGAAGRAVPDATAS